MIATQQVAQAWKVLQSLVPVSAIHNEQQYNQALETLNELLDTVGDNEAHPLYDLLDTLGILIHTYEEIHYPPASVTGIDVLKFLMEEHQLTPVNLPELGDQSVVSELLTGKRELDMDNIKALSKRFNLSPATFFDFS